MKIQRKVFSVALVASFLLSSAGAISVDENELRTTNGEVIQFENYTGPHAVIETADAIRGIGVNLGRRVSAADITTNATYGRGEKYTVIHAVDPSTQEKLDADILLINENATVDHIRNLRRIIAGYLSSAYGYSASDASTLATFVTVYNAVYRGRYSDFQNKYKTVVLNNLDSNKCGLSTRWDEWPGNSQIVIPLFDLNGGLSTVDTSVISDKDVINSMQEEDDKGIDERVNMTDLKEREADAYSDKAQDASDRADKAQEDADKAKSDADKAKQDADKAQSDANKAQSDADKAKSDADKAQSDADKAKQDADNSQSEADKAKQDADKAQSDADKAKQDADKAQSEADKAKQDADKAQADADKAKQDAQANSDDKAKQEAAQKAQEEADKAKQEADKAQSEADKAQSEADKAQSEADKAKSDADKAQSDADKAKSDADKAQSEADKAKSDADKAQSDADKSKEEADKAKSDADKAQEEADKAQSEADNARQEAEDAQAIADKKQSEAQDERTEIAKDKQKLLQEALAEADRQNAVIGLALTDNSSQLSGLVRVNATTGDIIRESPVNVIRGRTVYPVAHEVEVGQTGNAAAGENTVKGELMYIAICGEEGGKNSAIKLCLLDSNRMEIQAESNETLSPDSVLVQNGDDFYCVIADNGKWVVAKYDSKLTLKLKSPVSVTKETPITVANKGIIVTSESGQTVLLNVSDLTAITEIKSSSASEK